MKRKNITTLLSRIALEQDEDMQALVSQFAAGKKTAGAPVAIRFRPVVREFITRVSQRLGISAAELVNILIEGVMLDTLAPRQAVITRLYERFWLLMDAHRLSMVNVATLLAGMNMGLSVLESRERTLDYLTAPVISQLAEWFGVSPDWLDGSEEHPVTPVTFTGWRDVADRLFPSVSAGTALPAITLIRRDYSTDSIGNTNDTVVCIRQLKHINGIALRVVTCSGIIPHAVAGNNEENTFLAFCEIMRKASLLGDIEAVSVPGHIFTQFIFGKELPASILSVLNIYLAGQKDKGAYPLWGNDEIKNFADSEIHLPPEWKAYTGELIKNRT
ncbi:conjugal transfer protein TraE [Serratia ureilytica]|uniref:conjugal transfer protein TraE n=1 Tax=Serratia ureilytica TaxID=300181 RepID=UPI0018D9D71F|nr:conjugal transfer protein TraE [Serratia ureilytica]MBH2759042.1 conjugal transfer protein TraE [Serratia ureilytica]